MSLVFPNRSTVVRAGQAEVVGAPNAKIALLVDSSATDGALSTVRVNLDKGSDGAWPHRHDRSAEMFYVLAGIVQVLSGTEIVRAEQGDVIVVPPRLPHAFSADRGKRGTLDCDRAGCGTLRILPQAHAHCPRRGASREPA